MYVRSVCVCVWVCDVSVYMCLSIRACMYVVWVCICLHTQCVYVYSVCTYVVCMCLCICLYAIICTYVRM